MAPLTFAYYCSGHGYGHATRVSAVASYLCNLKDEDGSPGVSIVSSAPKRVFKEAVASGAKYRCADIDPVIVQPLAYHVDRRKSVDVLKSFIDKHELLVQQEASWLKEVKVDCVLSDAAFLGCKAAHTAGIPSVLITNFTFDSVYSYLSITFPENSAFVRPRDSFTLEPLNDEPISVEELRPLVEILQDGYRCASLLLRLPGHIPIPSFGLKPSLPSHLWTDPARNRFLLHVLEYSSEDVSVVKLHAALPTQSSTAFPKRNERRIVQAPLIVRHPSEDIHTQSGRKRLLDSIGVPEHLHSSKILVVSFGGQIFRRPQSRMASRSHSPTSGPSRSSSVEPEPEPSSMSTSLRLSSQESAVSNRDQEYVLISTPIATNSHLWVPGAPPASRSPIMTPGLANERRAPRTRENFGAYTDADARMPTFDFGGEDDDMDVDEEIPGAEVGGLYEPSFLPDERWVAIVCGAVPQKPSTSSGLGDELPPRFFLAPTDVYMPDLTAVADVLLGKLGYGTTAECVDAQTPFVFVPRPLFVEEHGLRRLLEEEGVGVELSQEAYESGEWAAAVRDAYEAGKDRKKEKRRKRKGDCGERRRDGEAMARDLVQWVKDRKSPNSG